MPGIAQQTFADYKVARLHVPVSMLPTLAETFKVQVDVLPGRAVAATTSAGKPGPASQLERSIERISELPKHKRRFVMGMLETVLPQAYA